MTTTADVVFVCTAPHDARRAESYIIRRGGEVKWIQKEASAASFFDDLIIGASTKDANTTYLDAVFESIVNDRGGAVSAPDMLITFPMRRFSTPGEWQSRFRELDKIADKSEEEIKDWAARFRASGVYMKGKKNLLLLVTNPRRSD